jgi:hypothetical protein
VLGTSVIDCRDSSSCNVRNAWKEWVMVCCTLQLILNRLSITDIKRTNCNVHTGVIHADSTRLYVTTQYAAPEEGIPNPFIYWRLIDYLTFAPTILFAALLAALFSLSVNYPPTTALPTSLPTSLPSHRPANLPANPPSC